MGKIIDFILGRHRDWRWSDKWGRAGQMQRWNGSAWEFRTAEPAEEAEAVSVEAW